MVKLVYTIDSKSVASDSLRVRVPLRAPLKKIGLIPKISVLFLYFRAISLILGIFCLI